MCINPIFHMLFVLSFLISYCVAWSFTGHELIAELSEDFLTQRTTQKVHDILDGRSLSSIAAWADTIKWMSQYKYTSSLHYINLPSNRLPPDSTACRFQWSEPGGQELISAIHNFTSILLDAKDYTWKQKCVATKLL